MGPPKPVCRDIIGAEERFAQTVKNFIGSYDPKLQPFVSRIAAGWAKQWSTMISPTLFPPAGDGLDEFHAKTSSPIFLQSLLLGPSRAHLATQPRKLSAPQKAVATTANRRMMLLTIASQKSKRSFPIRGLSALVRTVLRTFARKQPTLTDQAARRLFSPLDILLHLLQIVLPFSLELQGELFVTS